MKIVHLYKDYFPPTVGGMEQTVERMATWQVRHGHEVTVLTSNGRKRGTVIETIDGVRVIRVSEWARMLSTPVCPSMPSHLAKLPADVYHHHFPSPPGEVSWLWKRPKGAMVVTWHCDIVRQAKFLVVYGRFIHDLLKSADAIMPTSEHQLTFSKFLPHYLDKCRVVPLGIDLAPFANVGRHAAAAAAFRAKHAGPIILFVGRLVFYKGLDVMIDAMKQLPGTLVIVGDGPYRANLEERWRASGLGERVVFAGMIPPKNIAEWMAAADVGVLPSVLPNETFGLSMVEMMACGIPCVCTDLGTGTTFVNQHEQTGLVVKPGDVDAMAGAVRRLLEDDALRRRFSDAARARAHTMFSVDAMMRGVQEVYERSLTARASAGAALNRTA
jgi:rhamnosyl/mannosyltransferase